MPAPFTLATGNELVSVAGVPISGFPTDGAAATFEFAADFVESIPGRDGGYQQIANRAGTLTIRLLPGSASNTYLSALLQAQTLAGASITGFQMVETSSGSFRVAASCQIVREPTIEFTRDAGRVYEWSLVTHLCASGTLGGQPRFLTAGEVNAAIAALEGSAP